MKRNLVTLLALSALPLLAACASGDAPLTWNERRDLAWQSTVIRTHFREAQQQADQSHAAGTLIIFPDRGASSKDLSATLLSGSTPAHALLSVPTTQRSLLVTSSTCSWITNTRAVAAPLRLSCANILDEATLLAQTDDLSLRARGLAIEFDKFKQTATFLTEGLTSVLQLATITDARTTALDGAVKIVGESSTKANATLQSVTAATHDVVKAIEHEHAEFAKQLQDIQSRVANIK